MTPEQIEEFKNNWPLITATPRPSRVVQFPRKDEAGKTICDVRIVLLTQAETMQCAAEAERKTRSLLGKDGTPAKDEHSRGYADVYVSASGIEVLYRCCKHPDDPRMVKPFFWKKDDIATEMSTDEIAALLMEYAVLQTSAGPLVSQCVDEEELQRLIDAVAEGGERFPFGTLSSGAQSQLLITMARRLRTSPTDSSSPGSQPASDASG